jgi:tripartite-type tricarboxylate transporter receptor subunit TctC
MLGRLLAVELAKRLGQNVTVKNVEGEVGNIGLRAAALAAPNGYTLLITTNAALINLIINPKLAVTAYNTPKDFEPIAYLGAAPNVIVVRPSSGIGSIAELIAKAKDNPGKLTCASSLRKAILARNKLPIWPVRRDGGGYAVALR